MKKISLILLYFFATATIIFYNASELRAEISAYSGGPTYGYNEMQIQDSAQTAPELANDIFNSAWNLALLLTGGGNFLPFLPNSLLYIILSFVVGLIFRRYEKKQLRKAGKLIDPEPEPKEQRPGFFRRLFKKNPA